MASIDSIMNQVFTEAREGPSLGCIDRCTVAELIEAQQQFPNQFLPKVKNDLEMFDEEIRELMLLASLSSKKYSRWSFIETIIQDTPEYQKVNGFGRNAAPALIQMLKDQEGDWLAIIFLLHIHVAPSMSLPWEMGGNYSTIRGSWLEYFDKHPLSEILKSD